MKKLILFAAALLAAVSFSSIALAGNVYDIPELKLSAEAPDGWIVVTRNASDNAEAEVLLGTDSAALLDYLDKSLIYLNILEKDFSAEIFINKMEDENSQKVISINGYSDKQLNAMAEGLMGMSIDEIKESAESTKYEGVLAEDVEWHSFEIYKHHQAVFIKLYYTKYLNGAAVPSIQYSTIQNGQNINVSVNSYSSEISSSLEETAKTFVDSIVFTEIQKGRAAIDAYTITKYVLVSIGIISIIVLAPYYIKAKKNKKDNISSSTQL